MTAAGQDDEMYAGDDHTLQFTCVDENSAALDLTGATLEWVMRRYENGPVVLRKTSSSGITVTSPTGGIAAVAIAAADTASLEGGIYYHGLAAMINGLYSTLAEGHIEVHAKVRQ